MSAYVEFVGTVRGGRCELSNADLRSIGKFTRENVVSWLSYQGGFDFVGTVVDMHAVCDDVHIPWATEEGRKSWERIFKPMYAD